MRIADANIMRCHQSKGIIGTEADTTGFIATRILATTVGIRKCALLAQTASAIPRSRPIQMALSLQQEILRPTQQSENAHCWRKQRARRRRSHILDIASVHEPAITYSLAIGWEQPRSKCAWLTQTAWSDRSIQCPTVVQPVNAKIAEGFRATANVTNGAIRSTDTTKDDTLETSYQPHAPSSSLISSMPASERHHEVSCFIAVQSSMVDTTRESN